MWDFISFWWSCFIEGIHFGHGAFAAFEGLCVLIGAGLLWHNKIPLLKRLHEQWKPLEERIMKWAFAIACLAFVISTVCIAPFLKYQEVNKQRADAIKENEDLKKIKNPASTQLKFDATVVAKHAGEAAAELTNSSPSINQSTYINLQFDEIGSISQRLHKAGMNTKKLEELIHSQPTNMQFQLLQESNEIMKLIKPTE